MALAIPKTWKGSAAGAATLTISLTTNTIATNDLLHFSEFRYDGSTANVIGTPTDSTAGANTWNDNPGTLASAVLTVVRSHYTVVVTAPTSVTLNKSAGNSTGDLAGFVYHITGADTTAPRDGTPGANTTAATTTPTHSSFSTVNAAAIAIASGTHLAGANTPTAPSGYTLDTVAADNNGSTGEPMFVGHQIYASTQTGITPAWGMTTSSTYALQIVAYKAASGGGSTKLFTPSISGVAAVSASLQRNPRNVPTGTINASAAVSVTLQRNPRNLPIGSITGAATVTATLIRNPRNVPTGQISGLSTVSVTITGTSGVSYTFPPSFSPAILYLLNEEGPYA